jgi:hypothetical protein
MAHGSRVMERRDRARVHAHGSVMLRDGEHELHGRLLMLSPIDVELRCDLDVDPLELVGKPVNLSVWWEQVGSWYAVRGQVQRARVESHSLVVSVEDPSPDLLAAIDRALADDDDRRAVCVMVVDTRHERRKLLAQRFRELGSTVVEATTRIEALALLHGTQFDVILVADTAPENVGRDLREYLALVHPSSLVLPLDGDTDPPRILAYIHSVRTGLGD